MSVAYSTLVKVGAVGSQSQLAGATVGTQAAGVASQSAAATLTARASAAELSSAAAPSTLSAAAIAALTDPEGISPIASVALEVESNRMGRTTAVVLRRADTLASVGASDASMDLQSLVDGRRNPSRRWAIADSSLADDSYAWGTSPGDGEILPVAFASSVLLTATVRNAQAAASSPLWSASTGTVTRVAGTDADGEGHFWRASNAGVAFPNAGWVDPGAASSVGYYQPAGVARDFTMTGYLRGDATLVARMQLRLTRASDSAVLTANGPTFTLQPVAGLTRIAQTVAMPDQGVGTLYSAVRWRLQIMTGNLATQVDVDAAEFYSGPDRGALRGLVAAGPSPQAVAELTWTDPRRVNRVELSGERRAGRITSARVDVTTNGTTWATAGVAWGGSGLAVLLDQTYNALGVRVYVEETTGGDAGLVWMSEVDPMLVLDVSTDLAALTVSDARVADPGQATSVIGNYQQGEATVDLDNTQGRYTPASNAALDTGHRVECALGIRYRNRIGNPRADVDLTGWGGSPSIERVYPATQGSPSSTSVRATSTVSAGALVTARAIAPSVPVTPGTTYRYDGWLHVESTGWAADSQGALQVTYYDSGGAAVGSAQVAGSVGGSGWQRLTGTLAAPAGAVSAAVNASGSGSTSGNAYRVEATSLRLVELDGSGNEVEYAELVPSGVYFSDPWDAPTGSTTVEITAHDRLARFASVPVTDDLRASITVSVLVRDLALKYLDLDDDRVAIDSSIGAQVIPFALPPEGGDLGTYLSDIAMAYLATLYLDPLDRLTLAAIDGQPVTIAAEIRADNALIEQSRPSNTDTTAAVVQVTAEPLVLGTPATLYSLPSGGIQIASGKSYTLVCDLDQAPATNASVTNVVADGAYAISSVVSSTSQVTVTIQNLAGTVLTIATLDIVATPIEASSLTSQVSDAPSTRRYGPRTVTVDARLIQTQAQLDLVAAALLSELKGIDDNGTRKLPVVTFTALGLIHVDAGDEVVVVEPATGIGSGYVLISRALNYDASGSLQLTGTARQASNLAFAVADSSISDDVWIAGY